MLLSAATLMSVFFSFISLCLALPTSNLVTRNPGSTDCRSGTTFYTCNNNGFYGCCSIDPCAISSCPDVRSVPPIITFPHTHIGTPGPTCSPGQHQIYQTSMSTICPALPDNSSSSSELWVSRSSDPSAERQQVITFPDIPSTAKNCLLNWTPHNQTLKASGYGITEVFTVGAPLPATVTSKTIGAIVGETIGSADFSDWVRQKDAGLQGHLIGGQNCSEEMNFMVQIGGDADGDVQLQLDGGSGFFLQYDC